MFVSKMKNSILIFSIVLAGSSCKENEKPTNEKSPEQIVTDTTKNSSIDQNQKTETLVEAKQDAFQNTSSVSLVGSWDDVDPADPGPGGQGLTFETNGSCNISEQEGGYDGSWSYNPTNRILNLKLSHTNGSGKIDSEVDNDYKIEEMTEDRIKITDLTNKYPMLGGFFWKSKTP
jgi:hypothetical protein